MDMSALLAALDTIVFERLGDGRFLAKSAIPPWCHVVRPNVCWEAPLVIDQVFPFLAVFLPEAERAWSDSGAARRIQSEPWAVSVHDAEDVHLVATAVTAADARALLVTRDELLYAEKHSVLQRARELRLVHGSLMREIEKKDILVHAIVHDLGAPLHSILGVLSLLAERTHDEPEAGWIALGQSAAKRQRELIDDILDVFTAEVTPVGLEEVGGVDLADVVRRVVVEREPVARMRDVRIVGPDVEHAHVVADPVRLFRVLTNLLDNALRYSPSGGEVRMSARRTDSTITIFVEDDGPGVPAELLPRLFEKLARGRDAMSKTGLGLFFCRITVENWGGGIGYERREDGGARFWVRLREAAQSRRRPDGGQDHGEATDAR